MDHPNHNGQSPISRSDQRKEDPPVVEAPVRQKLKVCLLDDDPSVLRATGRLLASAGWDVQTFNDPIEFLRHAKSQPPRVVVIDILMPIMNGLEVQARLRQAAPSTRVIVMTSKDDPAVRNQAMEAGASAFFLKPVRDDEFLSGVESAASPEA
jgi:two-component system response regulator HydG